MYISVDIFTSVVWSFSLLYGTNAERTVNLDKPLCSDIIMYVCSDVM